MHLLWLAEVEDDTIFIITLGVLLLVVTVFLFLAWSTVTLVAYSVKDRR